MARPDVLNGEPQHIVDAFREKFSELPLLQSGHIPRAEIFEHPETLDREILLRLELMGRTFMAAYQQFVAVAYTEFRPEVFQFFGVDPHYNNVIYFRQKKVEYPPLFEPEGGMNLSGAILLNPKVSVYPKAPRFVSMEGCGSIDWGMSRMFALRAYAVDLRAVVYHPMIGSIPQYCSHIDFLEYASVLVQHECDHLIGYDATNSPNTKILDPWSSDFVRLYGEGRKEWPFIISEKTKRDAIPSWIVRRNGRLMHVDGEGKFLKLFIREK